MPVLPPVTSGRRLALWAKRGIDIVGASFGLLLLGPLLLFVALAIRLGSKGPVLFRQQREGTDGRPFAIFKFRTMYAEACDLSGVRQTQPNDARVTGIGRFIRATSIDELPQLLNVLKGDMSLVGPRPHVEGMLAAGVRYDELVPYYKLRHAMRPGITGWAQANGYRGPTEDAATAIARVDHDLAYIQNFSLWLDIVALAMTIRNEFTKRTGI